MGGGNLETDSVTAAARERERQSMSFSVEEFRDDNRIKGVVGVTLNPPFHLSFQWDISVVSKTNLTEENFIGRFFNCLRLSV